MSQNPPHIFYSGLLSLLASFPSFPPKLTPITPPKQSGGGAEPSISQSITYSGWSSFEESGHGYLERDASYFQDPMLLN